VEQGKKSQYEQGACQMIEHGIEVAVVDVVEYRLLQKCRKLGQIHSDRQYKCGHQAFFAQGFAFYIAAGTFGNLDILSRNDLLLPTLLQYDIIARFFDFFNQLPKNICTRRPSIHIDNISKGWYN
jgi:hypothetical protein